MKTTTRTRKAPKMSDAQKTYALAKAAHDAAKAAFEATCIERGAVYAEGMTEEQEEAIWERREDIRAELDLSGFSDVLRAAEQAMVEWSLDHAKKFSPAHAALVDEVHTRAKVSHKYWPQLVDIAFRLAA